MNLVRTFSGWKRMSWNTRRSRKWRKNLKSDHGQTFFEVDELFALLGVARETVLLLLHDVSALAEVATHGHLPHAGPGIGHATVHLAHAARSRPRRCRSLVNLGAIENRSGKSGETRLDPKDKLVATITLESAPVRR